MKNKKLNETTLEARIGSVLKNVFPTFKNVKVKHQESFSLKFGHHNVTINNKEPSSRPSRAIYDILLTTEDEKSNLILLELKKEGKRITDEDIEQGLSYARLIHPMPPITLLSNGKENLFYDTYTKKVLKNKTVDLDFIKLRIENTFSLALNDFKQTIEILLSKDPKLLIQVINDISKYRFEFLKGKITDLTKPICTDFIIKRKYTKIIEQKSKEKNLIGIIGAALSGKTNILYDYFNSHHNNNNNNNNNAIYYIDCRENNYSIFQQIANHLTSELNFTITKNKVREWFISSLNNTNISFTFLLDNFEDNISQEIKDEVTEFIDIFKESNHTIIFTIDLINYELISKNKFRNHLTLLGKKTFVIKLTELDLEEFEKIQEDLLKVSKCFFEFGSHFAIEYRQPRILRLIASSFHNKMNALPKNTGFKIVAVPDYVLLKMFADNNSFSFELRELYKKLTRAFINDRLNKSNSWALNLSSYYGGISLSSIKSVFKTEVDELFKSSFVTKHEIQKDIVVIYPKIPELISFFGIEYITSLLIAEYTENQSIEQIYIKFEKLCMPFINSDNVGLGVLQKILRLNKGKLFLKLVQYLQVLKPTADKINDGTKIAMLIDEETRVNIEFKGDNFEESFINNHFPYLVLSQLAGYPMQMNTKIKMDEFNFHLGLILSIANNPTSIIRVSNFTLENTPQIEVFEINDVGTFLSGHNGIIEPIVQSIQKCFHAIPEQIERLYEYAVANKLYLVIWRIYLAIRNETSSSNDDISNKSKIFLKKFDHEFPKLFKELLNNNT